MAPEGCGLGEREARVERQRDEGVPQVVEPDALAALLEALERPGVGLAGGSFVWPDGRLQEAGGAVQASTPAVDEGDFRSGPGSMPVVDAEQLLDVPVLVDARAAERYRGETEPVDPVAGHIPGAVNVPTSTNLGADGRFRSADQLRALYEAAGVPLDGTEVAVYCGSGVTAVHDLIALELLGVHATLYPGSWSEWVTDPERPVERQ